MYVHAVWKSQFLDLKRLDGLINSATSFGSKYRDLTVVNSNRALLDDQTKLNEMWGRIFRSRTTVPFIYFNNYAYGPMWVKMENNFRKTTADMGISYDPSFDVADRGPGRGLVWGDGPDALKGYIALLKEALAKMLEDYNKTKKAMQEARQAKMRAACHARQNGLATALGGNPNTRYVSVPVPIPPDSKP